MIINKFKYSTRSGSSYRMLVVDERCQLDASPEICNRCERDCDLFYKRPLTEDELKGLVSIYEMDIEEIILMFIEDATDPNDFKLNNQPVYIVPWKGE